jgi:MerR family copper efflux transcriptional regulator
MTDDILSTGGLAKEVGVGVETVRFYERLGILPPPPRSPGGYRQYDRTNVTRLRFVRSAQELGFTLEEIRELLALRVEPGPSCSVVAETADLVLARIEEKLGDLRRMRRALISLRSACHQGVAASDCPLLDALEEET